MSRLFLTKGAAPATPASNKSALYVDTTDTRTKQIDSNGVISVLSETGFSGQNVLHNGGFRINQRSVPGTSVAIPALSLTTRAGQVADRWAVTSSVTGATLSWQQVDLAGTQETNLSSRYYGSMIVATTARRVLLTQVVLSSDMSHLRGKKVRLSIKHNQKVGSGQVYNLGLLQLTNAGTVDVMPTFLTGSFSTSSGVDPAWGTNLSVIAPDASPTGENGTVGASWLACTTVAATWTKSSAVWTVPTSAKNLVFVFFQNTTGSTTDNISVSEAMITLGTEIVDYVEIPLGIEMQNCQRFFSKSFPYAILPAVSVSVANGGFGACSSMLIAGSGTLLGCQIPITFPVRMWTAPAITYYTPTASGAVVFRHSGASPLSQGTTATLASSLTDMGCVVTSTNEATANTAVGNLVSIHWSAEADFIT